MKLSLAALKQSDKTEQNGCCISLHFTRQVKKSATACDFALLRPPANGWEQAGNPLSDIKFSNEIEKHPTESGERDIG